MDDPPEIISDTFDDLETWFFHVSMIQYDSNKILILFIKSTTKYTEFAHHQHIILVIIAKWRMKKQFA